MADTRKWLIPGIGRDPELAEARNWLALDSARRAPMFGCGGLESPKLNARPLAASARSAGKNHAFCPRAGRGRRPFSAIE
jgi:hypothetical protein